MARELEGEDLKIATAIRAACEGIGMALLVTFREAIKPTLKGVPGKSDGVVQKAWEEAADKIIDVLMEED